MKEIKGRTKGFWKPTPGGVYPILRDLEKSGYIKGQWQTQKNRRLKIYKITKTGETILKRAIEKQSEIFRNISNLFNEFSKDVLNIEPTTTPPGMPAPFSPFLEDKSNREETLEELEQQHKHIVENIKCARDHLKEIEGKISKLKKEAKSTSSNDNKQL
jgi:DNA-binding MarR family transcriptional regulator